MCYYCYFYYHYYEYYYYYELFMCQHALVFVLLCMSFLFYVNKIGILTWFFVLRVYNS